MVEETLRAFGRIDVLVNNAGINPSRTPVHETSEEHWDRTLAVNLTGAFLCSKYVLPVMMKQERGSIIHIASIIGAMGCSDRAPYAALFLASDESAWITGLDIGMDGGFLHCKRI